MVFFSKNKTFRPPKYFVPSQIFGLATPLLIYYYQIFRPINILNVIFENHYMFIVKYIYNSRGTCSSAQMLKGCIVRERLGTPALRGYFQQRITCPAKLNSTLHCFG